MQLQWRERSASQVAIYISTLFENIDIYYIDKAIFENVDINIDVD